MRFFEIIIVNDAGPNVSARDRQALDCLTASLKPVFASIKNDKRQVKVEVVGLFETACHRAEAIPVNHDGIVVFTSGSMQEYATKMAQQMPRIRVVVLTEQSPPGRPVIIDKALVNNDLLQSLLNL